MKKISKGSLFKKNPFLVVVLYYIIAILIGTAILSMPFLLKEGQEITLLDAFFMSNSSFATTGLVTFDFTTTYNYLGWIVLVIMFNIGGMGIIVLNTVLILFIGKKIGFKTRMLAKLDYNQTSQINIATVLKNVVLYFLTVEIICTILIFFSVINNYDSIIDAFMNALFMVASAISGSGFYNTVPYNQSYFIQLVLIVGMIFSFIGYPVIVDVHDYFVNKIKKQRFHFSRFTKIAVSVNAVTVFIFGLLFFLLEKDNPSSEMSSLNLLEQIQWSAYISFSTKSVGLNLFSDINTWRPLTLLLSTIFMLIGGSPSSACGGIRIGAIYVIYKHLGSVILGKDHVLSFGYVVSNKNILKAYSVTFLYVLISFFSTVVIYLLEKKISLFNIWYDVVSGFTTTGFSTGALSQMGDYSIFIIAILMGVGRIGIMNLVSIIAYRQDDKKGLITYLEKDVTI